MEGILVLNDENRITITVISILTDQLFREHHYTPLGSHFGRQRTYLSLHRRYFWRQNKHTSYLRRKRA
jgi:hypothetical protein